MTTESEGVVVDIVGIEASNSGRSCEEHDCCGSVLQLDYVVRFRRVQIVGDDGKEESALAVYWVTDAIDRCRVGFLPRHLLKHKEALDGRAEYRAAQIVEFLALSESPSDKAKSRRSAGVCRAVLLELDQLPDPDKKKKRNSESGESPELSKKQK
jgi:hypothetical protein